MKKMLLIVFSLLLSSVIFADSAKWYQNYNQAKELAKKENKYMLMDFTGSDWCPWCKKLSKEVFKTKKLKMKLLCKLFHFFTPSKTAKLFSNENQKKLTCFGGYLFLEK